MTVSLDKLKPGQSASVVALLSTNPARLERLSGYGMVPGSTVHMSQHHPALIVRVGETEISLDSAVAREILVRPG
jgi:Fe2+ transport system protein FeoA